MQSMFIHSIRVPAEFLPLVVGSDFVLRFDRDDLSIHPGVKVFDQFPFAPFEIDPSHIVVNLLDDGIHVFLVCVDLVVIAS